MDSKTYTELKKKFTGYIIDKNLRKTEERYKIFEHICTFPGHFDINTLYEKLETENYHVSKATLYNTLDLLTEAGLVVKHQITPQSIQYELRILAETHQHLVCTKCGEFREIRSQTLKADLKKLKVRRFTPEYYSLYIFGICSKCTFRIRQEKKALEKQKNKILTTQS